jgi:hypothetical protein
MKIKFTTLRLQADGSGLIVLHLPSSATVTVRSPQVWLTHSRSNQDYVLKQGTTLSVMAGLVLIDGESAMVDVCATETSVIKTFVERVKSVLPVFKNSQQSSCTVCVHV